jgi:hypothetical protein
MEENCPGNHFGTDTVSIQEVIITTLSRRGTGTPESPIRVITEIWNKQGELITAIDPYIPTFPPGTKPLYFRDVKGEKRKYSYDNINWVNDINLLK